MVRFEGPIVWSLLFTPVIDLEKKIKQDMVNMARDGSSHWGRILHPREKTGLISGKKIAIHLGGRKKRSCGRESIISNQ